ncbi:MAG TPA: hypothetical protein VK817_20970 [Trebonia sp.]|nr:hypothetical protein [Trebonia sp.]
MNLPDSPDALRFTVTPRCAPSRPWKTLARSPGRSLGTYYDLGVRTLLLTDNRRHEAGRVAAASWEAA